MKFLSLKNIIYEIKIVIGYVFELFFCFGDEIVRSSLKNSLFQFSVRGLDIQNDEEGMVIGAEYCKIIF